MEKITRRVKALARCYGASAVGVTTIRKLEGGPPSTDLTYVLGAAKSAVSYAVPLDKNHIEDWFGKNGHKAHLQNNIQANVMASGISPEMRALYEEM